MMGERTSAHVQNQKSVIRVRHRFVFTRHVSKLTRVQPGSNPSLEVHGLALIRVETGLGVFTRQKLTRDSLCRVNRA